MEYHSNIENEIVKDKAQYYFIYSKHPNPVSAESLPNKTDALWLESGVLSWSASPLEAKNSPPHPDSFFKDQIELVKEADKRNLPIILSDFTLKDETFVFEILGYLGVTLAEATASLEVVRRLPKNARNIHTRRGFLKASASILAIPWLIGPAVDLGILVKDDINGKITQKGFRQLTHQLHPELSPYSLKARNAIIAEKEEWLQKKWGGNKHFTTVIGEGHLGIENDIRNGQTIRLNFLRGLKPLFSSLSNDPESFYTVAILKKDSSKRYIVEKHIVPELYQLFKDVR